MKKPAPTRDNRERGDAVKIVMTFVAGCVLATVAPAWAQTDNYPAKPIRLISPFPPGGSVDFVARLVAAKMPEYLGQQMVVENRSGASGNIGTEIVARSAPDGYNLVLNTTPFVSNAFLYQKLPYDPITDFAPVIQVSTSQSILAVHPSLPVYTVKELLALARSKPGKLNYGSSGPATNPHISGELFNYLGKVNITVVHFKGGGPALIACMSGEVDVVFANYAETLGHVKAGKLRALGVSSSKRAPTLPDVPTIAEAGLPGYEFTTWHGILAPKATPRPIVALLNDRMKKSLMTPDQVKRFQDHGLDIVAGTPEEFAAFIAAEYKKWGRVIKERGMRAE
jgi:tripartite-type tricarboxylate transporter receptor subunit TctC